jgi:DNA-binding transcriptional MerR regulator
VRSASTRHAGSSRRPAPAPTASTRGKNLGFTLEEIAEYLALYDADPAQDAQTRHLAGKVEAHIADLVRKRADLDRALRELKDIRAACAAHLARSAHARRG